MKDFSKVGHISSIILNPFDGRYFYSASNPIGVGLFQNIKIFAEIVKHKRRRKYI